MIIFLFYLWDKRKFAPVDLYPCGHPFYGCKCDNFRI
nr:MAG TPA_asm: Major transforming protein E5 family [Caudoviricetes sp.]